MNVQIPLARMKHGRCFIWDCGPQTQPVPPSAPTKPDDRLKGHELAAAEVEYEDALVGYKDQLRAYTAARKAYQEWHTLNGGPIKIEQWGIDAIHSLTIEPNRYKLDLPKGARPGHAQLEAEERARKEREELERAAAMDPQFGTQSGVAA